MTAKANSTKKAAPKKAAAKAPAKKAAPKAAPKKAAKTKRPARPAAAKAAKAGRAPHRPDPLTLPGHHATKMEHARHEDAAEHAHQDPRWPQEKPDAARMPAHTNPRLDQGAIKTRGVPRMNPMVNWFRRAPKSKA